MENGLDVDLLRRKLETRFQLSLIGQKEIVDGGTFDTIRPSSLEQGNSFAILLSRTHRQFEASFRADNFAGSLLREMSEACASGKATFVKMRKTAETAGEQINVAINGDASSDCINNVDRWSKVEVDVARRFPASSQPADLMATALQVTSTCLSLVLTLTGTEEAGLTSSDNSVSGLPEGAKLRVEVNRYERSPVNRVACIEHYGLNCQCCGFDFQKVYGQLGEGYIEVHHRTPVSQLGPGYLVDPIEDLIPLCANCHAAVHRNDPPVTVQDLKTLMQECQEGILPRV
jgi:5-methylcytosine-specific restriction protein A